MAAKTAKTAKSRRAATPRRARKPAAAAPARARSIERRPDHGLVKDTLAMLRAHDQLVGSSLRQVGAHLLGAYFGGDEEAVRSHSPVKGKSFALLAEWAAVETDWTEADLRRAVIVELVARSLPAAIATALESTPTYLHRLDAVKDLKVRRDLARRIAGGELHGQAAKDAISESSGRAGAAHDSRPEAVRFVVGQERAFARAEAEHLFDPHGLARLDGSVRQDLARRLEEQIRHLRAIVARLKG